jgi:hypothetical protein
MIGVVALAGAVWSLGSGIRNLVSSRVPHQSRKWSDVIAGIASHLESRTLDPGGRPRTELGLLCHE